MMEAALVAIAILLHLYSTADVPQLPHIGSLKLIFGEWPSLGIGFPDTSGTAASDAGRVFWFCRASRRSASDTRWR
jgi:hypothetical protein